MIGAVSGVCFAALAARALGVLLLTPRFRAFSLVYAAITAVLSYFSFRAATAGQTDEASFLRAFWGGCGGASAGLLIVFAAYVMFRDGVRVYLARPLGLHLSEVTMFRVVVASLLLGFATGFALRTPTHGRDRAEDTERE